VPPTADAAKKFNKQLWATAASLAAMVGAHDYEYAFVCECGCEETVRLTLAEYDEEGGAWLEGHRPRD
jgi:hypothetical protein